MQCPYCGSTEIRKNGKRKGKQNHICTHCYRQLTRVENENTRLRHYLARFHCKTLRYSKSEEMLRYLIKLLLYLLKYETVPT